MSLIGNLTLDEIQKLLNHAGSWKRFATQFGVTEAEIASLRAAYPGFSWRVLQNRFTAESLQNELKRVYSTAVFCLLYDCKESELRELAESLEVDVKRCISPQAGTTGIGRQGELYVKQIRGQMITEDTFETQSHSAPYDLMDLVYERINVKTGAQRRHKSKTRQNNPLFWHFSTKGWEQCDTIAFVPLDSSGKPKMMLVAKSSEIGALFPRTVTMTGNDIKETSACISSCQNNFGAPRWEREYTLYPERLSRATKKIEQVEDGQDSAI